MKLKRLRVRNFRCYQPETTVDFDDITALVGRNDVGKSSIMDALDLFLNDGAPDRHDAAKMGDARDLTIVCEFDELPTETIIDDANPTSLADEFLLNPDGRLEIHKTYSGHLQTPKCTNISIFAMHPSAENVSDLLQLKNSELKRRATAMGLAMEGVDQRYNAPIRRRIRDTVADLAIQSSLVPLNENNGKSVWDSLKTYLPVFALFKSDRQSTDQDPEAQDPLKAAVKEAIKAKEGELAAIAKYVEEEVKKVADKTVEKTREMDISLATQLNPQFTPPKWDTLFKASITGDDEIPLNKRGSGVRRLLLLNFFRAKAEIQANERKSGAVIYGIEEPETSQHPHNQRLLVRALTDLSGDNQVVITTHTPMLARGLPDASLRFIRERDDRSREVLVGGFDTNRLFAESLGVLPDNSVKLFIGIEGRNDIHFLRNVSSTLRAAGEETFDLEKMELEGELIFVPLGGSSLALWTSRLANLARPEFYLFDRDTQPPAQAVYQAEADEINQRPHCRAEITQKREMENYVHWLAINQAYQANGLTLGLTRNFADFEDVSTEVAKLVHRASGSPFTWDALPRENRAEKASSAKRTINGAAAKMMTKAQLDEMDPNGEIVGWFATMRRLVDETSALAR
jgi:putative ATP-dependent endonuclease of OLD family